MIDRDTGWYFAPASIKAVVVRGGEVLLCRNSRDEWELPGGWPDRQDLFLEETLRREVLEETGLNVHIDRLLTSCLFRPTKESSVVLVIFQATAAGDGQPVESFEHSAVAFFPFNDLPTALPEAYRSAVELAAQPPDST